MCKRLDETFCWLEFEIQNDENLTDLEQYQKLVAWAGISVPCRYIHSPNSLCSLGDMEAAYQLARHFLLDEMWKEVLHHAGT